MTPIRLHCPQVAGEPGGSRRRRWKARDLTRRDEQEAACRELRGDEKVYEGRHERVGDLCGGLGLGNPQRRDLHSPKHCNPQPPIGRPEPGQGGNQANRASGGEERHRGVCEAGRAGRDGTKVEDQGAEAWGRGVTKVDEQRWGLWNTRTSLDEWGASLRGVAIL